LCWLIFMLFRSKRKAWSRCLGNSLSNINGMSDGGFEVAAKRSHPVLFPVAKTTLPLP
jgi:hypothetical protein